MFPTLAEAREMFQRSAKTAPRSTSKKWFELDGRPITRDQLHQAGITLKNSQHTCKFSLKPKYFCEVNPNEWNLRWLYSCPCADCGEGPKGTHLFFNDNDLTAKCGDDTKAKKEHVISWLQILGWTIVWNQDNKRYICPLHINPMVL